MKGDTRRQRGNVVESLKASDTKSCKSEQQELLHEFEGSTQRVATWGGSKERGVESREGIGRKNPLGREDSTFRVP